MPSTQEIRQFSSAAAGMLHDLEFRARRGIVLKTVDKVVASERELTVYGRIPISDPVASFTLHRSVQKQNSKSGYVESLTNDRYGLNTARQNQSRLIPFELKIDLPTPLGRGVDYGFGAKVKRA